MGDSDRQSETAPVESRRRRQKAEVFNEVLNRLKELDFEEAIEKGFEDELWAHFIMLPVRYALDINTERAEDVLLHKKLLCLARDPLTRPAIDVRLVKARSMRNGDSGDAFMSDGSCRKSAFGLSSSYKLAFGAGASESSRSDASQSGESHLFRPLHEITISTKDEPKLLSRLTCLMSEIGLNIQEAHAFCTVDGYSLDVFVVDGWECKGLGDLRNTLVKEIQKIEKPIVLKQEPMLSADDNVRNDDFSSPTKNSEFSCDESDVWEINSDLLNFEYKIASGPNGDLYKGSFRSQDVAIKVFNPESSGEDVQREFAQEVYILRKVRHKNVVQFIGACTRPPLLCIVNEFMSGGSLYDFIHNRKAVLKLPEVLKIAIDVSKGMSYLHLNRIIHRDLKSANLLINENNVVKVADFGVARVQHHSGVMTSETGTYRWMAPEVIEHKPYNQKADVFSFGILIWELLTGKLPYAHLTPLQAAVGVVQKGLRPAIPRQTHPLVIGLLEGCWHHEPSLRPDFSELIDILGNMVEKVQGEERVYKKRNLGES